MNCPECDNKMFLDDDLGLWNCKKCDTSVEDRLPPTSQDNVVIVKNSDIIKTILTESEKQYYNQMLQDDNIEEIERIEKLIRERSN